MAGEALGLASGAAISAKPADAGQVSNRLIQLGSVAEAVDAAVAQNRISKPPGTPPNMITERLEHSLEKLAATARRKALELNRHDSVVEDAIGDRF